jgi:hypothetical protein
MSTMTTSGLFLTDAARAEIVAEAWALLVADVESGCVPRDVATFADLHDYVDANMYLDSDDDGSAWSRLVWSLVCGSDPHSPGDGYDEDSCADGCHGWADEANAITEQIDARIRAGELRRCR